MGLNTPVLLIIFRRLDTTQHVFGAIRQAQPKQLFVAADGPREGKEGEAEKCRRAREIVKQVDWDCAVHTLFQEKNLGCGWGPASAINWFFENVEEGIILEDDCVPHITFFRFCEELLTKYRDDERIMMISGFNPLGKWKSESQSYHFSYTGASWGWASWRRAWDYYDIDMKLWGEPEVKNAVKHTVCHMETFNFFKRHFEATYNDINHTYWDNPWQFARLLYSGLSVVPSANLISNIGFFGEGETTNLGPAHPFVKLVANLPLYSLSFPLKEPYGVTDDRDFSRMCYLKAWKTIDATLIQHRISYKVKNILIKLLRLLRLYSLAVIVVGPLYRRLARKRTRRRQEHAQKLKG